MAKCLANKVTAVFLGLFSYRAAVHNEKIGLPSNVNQIVSVLPEPIC